MHDKKCTGRTKNLLNVGSKGKEINNKTHNSYYLKSSSDVHVLKIFLCSCM